MTDGSAGGGQLSSLLTKAEQLCSDASPSCDVNPDPARTKTLAPSPQGESDFIRAELAISEQAPGGQID